MVSIVFKLSISTHLDFQQKKGFFNIKNRFEWIIPITNLCDLRSMQPVSLDFQ